MTTPRPTFMQLAQHAAAQIGFTVRRWWRDATDFTVLCVEVERRLMGAPPAIAQLRVPLPSPARARLSRMPPGQRGTVRTRTR